jgi:DNA-directed RNA polymerase specialized sigma24 family protein
LSPPARAVLLLRYQEDLDPVEIARALDMPLNTVKSHLQRSLRIMREKTIGTQPVRCEDSSYE